MFYEIFCVMSKGQALTDEMRTCLVKVAAQMVREKEEKCKIQTTAMEGCICTKFQRAILGSVSGFSFSAELESESGRTNVEFLVRDCDQERIDLENGFWMTMNPQMAKSAMNN